MSRECPRSVKKVSGHSGDTLGILFGHSGARCQKGPRDTPSDTPSDIPHFRGHFVGHTPGHFGPEGPERLLCLLGEFATFVRYFGALPCATVGVRAPQRNPRRDPGNSHSKCLKGGGGVVYGGGGGCSV